MLFLTGPQLLFVLALFAKIPFRPGGSSLSNIVWILGAILAPVPGIAFRGLDICWHRITSG
jgi:hypothetical protein